MADEADSKSVDGNIVRVQVPLPALLKHRIGPVFFCSPQVEASTHEVGICFQAGVHEQNEKSRSDDGCGADGFASVGEAPASGSKHCEAVFASKRAYMSKTQSREATTAAEQAVLRVLAKPPQVEASTAEQTVLRVWRFVILLRKYCF